MASKKRKKATEDTEFEPGEEMVDLDESVDEDEEANVVSLRDLVKQGEAGEPEVEEEKEEPAGNTQVLAELSRSNKELRSEARKVVTTVRRIHKAQSKAFVEIAEAFYKVNTMSLYMYTTNPNDPEKKMYKSLEQYVAAETTYDLRSFQYLCRIWEEFVVKRGDDATLLNRFAIYGWSKLQPLIQLVNAYDEDDILQDHFSDEASYLDTLEDILANNSTRKLKEKLAAFKDPKLLGAEEEPTEEPVEEPGSPEEPEPKKVKNMTFQMTPKQEVAVEDVIGMARRSMGGNVSRGQALEFIAKNFEAQQASFMQKGVSGDSYTEFSRFIMSMEESLGIMFVAYQVDEGQPLSFLYGERRFFDVLASAEGDGGEDNLDELYDDDDDF